MIIQDESFALSEDHRFFLVKFSRFQEELLSGVS